MNIYLFNTYYRPVFISSVIIFNSVFTFSFNTLTTDSLSQNNFPAVNFSPDTISPRIIYTSKNDSKKSVHDSLEVDKSYILFLDSLKPVISDIVITGNKITQDEIILREMKSGKGKIFTAEQYEDDNESIYNLGLFVNADIIPVLQPENKVILNVKVHEKWYIFPSPFISFTDGDLTKWTAGLGARWQNFRGRNESVSLSFGVGYNPFIRASYSIPWIGSKMHLFTTVSGSYSRDANRSLLALGRNNGDPVTYNRDSNFDYINYTARLTMGKFFTKQFSVFADIGYTFLRVSQYQDGRTLSPDGVDRYLLLGVGTGYDTRNFREYATKGYYFHANYEHYGLVRRDVNFGRLNAEAREFIPVNFTNDYYITLASRFYTSVAIGSVIPFYNHKYLGFGDDFVRGWARLGYEGDDDITLYNEVRIPIIQPSFIKGDRIPLIKKLPYLKDFSYRYGLYFTMFYDFGGIWNKDDKFQSIKFMSGTGIGLNAILPFGLIGKIEWAFRLGKPTAGQVIVGAGAKF